MKVIGIEDREFPEDAVVFRDGTTMKVKDVRDSKGRILWSTIGPRDKKGRMLSVGQKIDQKTPVAVKSRSLPRTLTDALSISLSNAQIQSLTNELPLSKFWDGYLTGMHQAIAILCGALNYDIEFLLVKDEEFQEIEQEVSHDEPNS